MADEPKADLVPEAEAANIIHQKKPTLAQGRSTGRGPAYYKIGRRIFYSIADLETWLASQRREPRSPRATALQGVES